MKNSKQVRMEKRAEKYQDALENFNKKQLPQSRPKKKTRWFLFAFLLVTIVIGVVLVVQMSQQITEEQKSFSEVFSVVTAQNALIAVAVLVLILLFDIVKFVIIIHSTTHKLRFAVSTKVSLWGRFYDNITPSATGGQPAQIGYLCSKGFSGGLSSAVVFTKYFFNSIVWLLLGCIVMAANTSFVQSTENGTVVLAAGWLGWGINVIIPFAILLFVAVPKLARKLAAGVIFVGYKLRIVKDREKTMQKALDVVEDFRSSFIIMAKRPLHLVLLLLSCFAEIALSFALPYFIIKMFNGFAVDEGFSTLFAVMGLNAYATIGASFIPTPGGSGAVESMITLAFSEIAGSTLMWVTFTWRFASFYIYILVGLGITIFNFVRSILRDRRAAKAQSEEQPPQQPTSPEEE